MKSNKNNVIWIFGDQHRAQAMSNMGDPNVSTPNLDRLAQEGVNFSNAVSGCPWCSPFRGSLLTSRYVHNTVPKTPSALDPKLPVITDPFNDAGYDTAYFGKWHLAGQYKEDTKLEDGTGYGIVPKERRGRFKRWLGYENNNNQYFTYLHGHDAKGNEIKPFHIKDYETDGITDLMLDYIDEKKGTEDPFFAVLSIQPPHVPYVAPAEYAKNHNAQDIQLRPNVPPVDHIVKKSKQDLAGYYAMIENLDYNVGRIMDKLYENGQINNTHILFFSDHGDMHGSHGRKQKSTPWEESIRIPMIVSGMRPHTSHTGMARNNAVFNHVDIAPTTLGLCGIEVPDWMMGFDYSDYRNAQKVRKLNGGNIEGQPESAYLQHVVDKNHPGAYDRTWRGIVTQDGWKYVVSEGFPYLMFDLNTDPYELNNVAQDPGYAPKRSELQSILKDWIEKTGDEYELPRI